MIFVTIDNLSAWLLQVFLIASAGALLPLLFRMKHPRSLLAYYHIVLLLCFALPVIQPWEDSLIVAAPRVSSVQPSESAVITWGALAVWILIAGVLTRLCWLGAGLWQLRRYRRLAVPICPLPEAIREAARLAGAEARFCISSEVRGPSTMGWIDPVVLLPSTFLSLDTDAQRGIACHELLHVRRRDWLITILEELAGTVFWFNPGVRWLLSQAKLSREQLVDAEVVRLTAKEPYIQALLSMALVSRSRWALPAASFFTRGHLVRRMRLLLTDAGRFTFRVCLSYIAMGCLLTIAVWSVFAWLPLGNVPRIVLAAPPPPGLFRLPIDHIALTTTPGTRGDEFNMQLQASEGPVANVRYFFHLTAPADGGQPGDFAFPAPPPPPSPPPSTLPGSFGFLEERGIRMVRPGEIASPEEIQRLREALGDRAVIDIKQAEDGTVQRVIVQARRLSNEASSIRTSIPIASAEPAGATDRVD